MNEGENQNKNKLEGNNFFLLKSFIENKNKSNKKTKKLKERGPN